MYTPRKTNASFTTIPTLSAQSSLSSPPQPDIITNTLSSFPSSSEPYTTKTTTITGSVSESAAAPANIQNELVERIKKSQQILEKYPDRVPLIIKPSETDRNSYPIDKSKYITPRDLMLAQLQQIIRKRIRFPPEKALFLFINNKMYPVTAIVGSLYDSNKDKDGFLYVTYCQESTFGGTSS
jgi:GABA(A) receptor-associated protein